MLLRRSGRGRWLQTKDEGLGSGWRASTPEVSRAPYKAAAPPLYVAMKTDQTIVLATPSDDFPGVRHPLAVLQFMSLYKRAEAIIHLSNT